MCKKTKIFIIAKLTEEDRFAFGMGSGGPASKGECARELKLFVEEMIQIQRQVYRSVQSGQEKRKKGKQNDHHRCKY